MHIADTDKRGIVGIAYVMYVSEQPASSYVPGALPTT